MDHVSVFHQGHMELIKGPHLSEGPFRIKKTSEVNVGTNKEILQVLQF